MWRGDLQPFDSITETKHLPTYPLHLDLHHTQTDWPSSLWLMVVCNILTVHLIMWSTRDTEEPATLPPLDWHTPETPRSQRPSHPLTDTHLITRRLYTSVPHGWQSLQGIYFHIFRKSRATKVSWPTCIASESRFNLALFSNYLAFLTATEACQRVCTFGTYHSNHSFRKSNCFRKMKVLVWKWNTRCSEVWGMSVMCKVS